MAERTASAALQEDPRVVVALAELIDVISYIDAVTRGAQLPKEPRLRISVACLDLAIEHQAGIHLLAMNGLFGPAYALLRCLVDATVRGLWLGNCATAEDIESFKKGGLRDKPFRALVEEFESAAGVADPKLMTLLRPVWRIMSDYTHTGFQHVARRCGDGFTGPNYDAVEVVGNLRMSASFGLLAALHMMVAANNMEAAMALLQRMEAVKAVGDPA